MSNETVTFDTKTILNEFEIEQKISKRMRGVQAKLDIQVLKDSNYYCPMYTGTLMKSGILNTVAGSGKVVWNTPYAKAQYYGLENKSKQHNPNATSKWFEVAKARRKKEWEKLVNDEYRKGN